MKDKTAASDPAQDGARWVDKFGRARTPRTYLERDDGSHAVGAEASSAASAYFGQRQDEHHATLRRLTPAARRAYATYKRTGHLPPMSGRATQQAGTRRRGAGRPKVRGAAQRTSARSGDSGEDSDSSEPPPRRLLCAYCGRPIPPDRAPQARYCSDRHADAERQRRKRQRERERHVTPRSSAAADYFRMLSFDPGELERLLSVAVCPCNGRHRSFEDDPESCQRCGRLRPGTVGGRRLLAQLDAVQAQLAAGREQVVA